MGWTTFDTAPKDGTEIDVWVRISTGYGYRRPGVAWCTTHNCWRIVEDRHYVRRLFENEDHKPTHWRYVGGPPPGEFPAQSLGITRTAGV